MTRYTPEWVEARSIPEPNTGCWLWTRATSSDGYGSVNDGKKTTGAHRRSYEAYNGPIPEGLFVLHSCDQPACVNPRHLRIGTHAENMAEKRTRRRSACCVGHLNPRAILTEFDVLAIRDRRRGGETIPSIAADYGMSRNTIDFAATGRSWPHLPGAVRYALR